jgi:hypothetical protein
MTRRDREGLVMRIRQIRRAEASLDEHAEPPSRDPEQAGLNALEARIAELEQVMQALQDSVHRES